MSIRWPTLLMLAAALLLGGVVPWQSRLGWIDPVTGSMKARTKFFLIPVSTEVRTSALERWIVRREGRYTNRWKFLHDTSETLIYGRCYACSTAPEIYPLRAGGLGDDFVRLAPDAEIAEFVRIMREGTSVEKERAVASACDRALGQMRGAVIPGTSP